ncbi:MAG: 4-hydroxy-tetrahydrodipicolinate reductase [Saprospiraceae bacterium]|nr:4-hydroxy-tetrahydrodipicolinate reductase [Saprospiraceae bacterium]MCF8248329.1 4-hydroxy-tetrahydrodipicolinate reductase [Saprospiraceae bacterium]MCF8280232.1 4-hydroxy-tetrahydrodipicolinate reductase [Bacteroidales bacterium]MCF8309857.1 4-hydroxy-tetrahydrodipicolinate reductase [Saprospiraceae bacterium]MCF8438812.1 4-hydroxy-tetrahydrodipicolinate reductase [Saprospiraceae bacterium]
MNLVLIGLGKMGKTIKNLSEKAGDSVVLTIDLENRHEFTPENLRKADVAIEFSRPETAFENIRTCLEAGLPVVSGTTGWLDRFEEAKTICEAKNGALFYASNYSIGVNVFFAVNRYLAKLMEGQMQYDVRMEETHHTQKLDHPSGTAITLAQGILENFAKKKDWQTYLQSTENEQFNSQPNSLNIISKRVENVPGTHVVTWESNIDTIEISHTAHSREGFAAGAIAAARWLVGKQGCFGMQDLLGF